MFPKNAQRRRRSLLTFQAHCHDQSQLHRAGAVSARRTCIWLRSRTGRSRHLQCADLYRQSCAALGRSYGSSRQPHRLRWLAEWRRRASRSRNGDLGRGGPHGHARNPRRPRSPGSGRVVQPPAVPGLRRRRSSTNRNDPSVCERIAGRLGRGLPVRLQYLRRFQSDEGVSGRYCCRPSSRNPSLGFPRDVGEHRCTRLGGIYEGHPRSAGGRIDSRSGDRRVSGCIDRLGTSSAVRTYQHYAGSSQRARGGSHSHECLRYHVVFRCSN